MRQARVAAKVTRVRPARETRIRFPIRPVAILILLPAPSALGAQTATGRVVVEADHPVCRAWLHDWAGGGEDAGLLTYGSPSGSDYGESAAATLLPPERAALGLDADGDSGPQLAGVTSPGPFEGSFVYPGPSEADEPAIGLRARGQLTHGAWTLAADLSGRDGGVRTRVVAVAVDGTHVAARGGLLGLRAGPECGGGLVLGASDRAETWGLELRQRAPLRLPLVGPLRIGVQLGALREAGPDNRWPLFHSMRIEVRPGPDVVIGLNRAVIFGGSETDVDVGLRTVALMLVGLTDTPGKDSDFENQVASADVRWRTRVADRPLLLTAEYGADDSGYAFVNVPAVRTTAELSLGPSAGWIGLTGTWVASSRKTYPPWYRHGALAWGWTDRGRPLGNPLGGNGKALLVTYRAEPAGTAWEILAGPVERGAENLYAPDLEGLGFHASGGLLRSAERWELRATAALDVADSLALRGSLTVVRRVGIP